MEVCSLMGPYILQVHFWFRGCFAHTHARTHTNVTVMRDLYTCSAIFSEFPLENIRNSVPQKGACDFAVSLTCLVTYALICALFWCHKKKLIAYVKEKLESESVP